MNTEASIGKTLLFFLVFGAVPFALIVWHFSRSRSILEEWVKDNGYEILDSEFRNFFRGPFFWTSGKGQTVYYVKTRDRDGRVRTGWVRCGGFWAGLLSNQAEVRWEDEL
jgi:hypothetical protein